jgi:hypothetical protein
MNEALRDIDDTARTTFMNTYCQENSREISIHYGLPQNKEGFDASYVIMLGQGEEVLKSIGGVEGNYDYREDAYLHERIIPKLSADTNRIEFTFSKPIGYFDSSPDVSFAEGDDLQLEGNVLSIGTRGNEILLDGSAYDMFYSSKQEVGGETPRGVVKGFTSNDEVDVVGISTNYDTARCLDMILKLLMITMRDSIEEKTAYSLQQVRWNPLAPVITDGDTVVFGRTLNIAYTVSYGVDLDFYRKVTKAIIERRVKNG